MVRAFLSIITIIYHPSSTIIFAVTSIGQKRRFGDYFFRDKGVLRETFFFSLLLTLFCTFVCFVFMQLIFNTWFSPFLRTHNEIGPRMWFPFFRFLYENTFSVMEFWFYFRLLNFSIWVWGLSNGMSTLRPCLHEERGMGGWGSWRLFGRLACVDVGKYGGDSACSAVNSSVFGLVWPRILCEDMIWVWVRGWRGVFCFFVLFSFDFSVAPALQLRFPSHTLFPFFSIVASSLLIELYSYSFSSPPRARLLSPPLLLKTCVSCTGGYRFSRFPAFFPCFFPCVRKALRNVISGKRKLFTSFSRPA